MGQSLVIEAANVILRPYRLDDLEAIYALTQEPTVVEFLPDWSVPRSQRRAWLLQYEIPENERFTAAAAQGGAIGDMRLRLAITVRGTGEFAGWCCTGVKDELPLPNREVVFAVSERFRNRGYATEAVSALAAYLLTETDAAAVNAVALPRNVASNKVIQRSGLSPVGVVDIDGEPYHHYRRGR